MKLDDQFEWDLENQDASSEQFAEVYANELGLGGEFKWARVFKEYERGTDACLGLLLRTVYVSKSRCIKSHSSSWATLPTARPSRTTIFACPSYLVSPLPREQWTKYSPLRPFSTTSVTARSSGAKKSEKRSSLRDGNGTRGVVVVLLYQTANPIEPTVHLRSASLSWILRHSPWLPPRVHLRQGVRPLLLPP